MSDTQGVVVDACPHADRVERTERNLEILTRDVDKLLRSQQQLVEIYTRQAEQGVEQKHLNDTLARAFKRIEEQAEEIRQLSDAVHEINSRANMVGVLARYWPVILGISVAAYTGFEMLRGLVAKASGAA